MTLTALLKTTVNRTRRWQTRGVATGTDHSSWSGGGGPGRELGGGGGGGGGGGAYLDSRRF